MAVFLMVALAALLAIGAPSRGVAAEKGATEDVPTCITVRTEARYRPYGYDHIVLIENQCERDAQCHVSTNVNPKEQRIKAPRGKTTEVLTFLGSPSREFTPRVACELE